jgi:hypothetical protein
LLSKRLFNQITSTEEEKQAPKDTDKRKNTGGGKFEMQRKGRKDDKMDITRI